MRRRCARFGCNATATATFTFDSRAQIVFLDTPADGGARAGELCGRHAAALQPPRGWQLEDRRSGAAPIATTFAPAPAAPAPGAAATPAAARPQLAAFASGLGPDSELDGMLDAQSPLLARAFRSSGRV